MSTRAAVETRALTKRFGRHRGVESLSLEVDHGEVFGSPVTDGLDPGACVGLSLAGALLAAAGCRLPERRDVGR